MKISLLSLCLQKLFVLFLVMYKITREEAAIKLNISTRSIDRYIRAGKLRSKKQWKIVYINEDDINNFLWIWTKKQEIIVWNITEKKQEIHEESSTSLSKKDEKFSMIFDRLKDEIKFKDDEIKELSMKVWKMEEVVKNSISMVEFKKTQFLLEESKNTLILDLASTKKELEIKNVLLKEEKSLNYILIIISIILFIVLITVWLIKI